jgi:hypothetical protein
MGQNLRPNFNRIGAFVALYGLWLVIVLLWSIVSLYLQRTLLVLALWVIQTPALRPAGWSTSTLVGINRCGYLILGGVWLGMVLYTERYLREGLDEGALLVRAGRLLAIIAIVFGLSLALTFLAA